MWEYLASSDEELIEKAKGGDEQAFTTLYERHKSRILNYSFALLGDWAKAWDVLQEAFLYLFRKLPTYRQEAKFTTLLYKVVKNLALTQVKQSQRAALLDTDELAPLVMTNEESPVEVLAKEEDRELAHKMLMSLPPTHREVLYLRWIEGLEYEEIAEILGCPVGTVKSRIHYGWQKLVQQGEKFLQKKM